MKEKKSETNRKEKLLEFILSDQYHSMKQKELSMLLGVPKDQKMIFAELIDELIEEGKIIRTSKGKIKPPDASMLTGEFMGTTKGFGFVRVEGEEEDIFIPASSCLNAMNGDLVMIQLWKKTSGKGKREGEILKILQRNTTEVVGTFSENKSFGFVISDNSKITKDLYIPKKKKMGAVEGSKVVAKITSYGEEGKNPEGEIIEVLGHRNDPGVDILSTIRAFGLPEKFPDEVMKETGKMPEEIDPKEYAGRTDYRELQTVTIDGEDAKDLDDAITLTKSEDGHYHLGVHIADVSHYVKEGSKLDKEAIKRGTSVYLVDRVIPMIPHKLSNGICSLNAGADRLTLSCMMEINEVGEVINHKISEAVICVDERMSYTDVNDVLTIQTPETMERYQDFVTMFSLMKELAHIMRKRRKKKGSIDFDFPECKIIVDKKGTPVDIIPYDRNVATRLIEEFMLAANQTVAEEYFWLEAPFLYRCHEVPDNEKIKDLASLVKAFGFHMKVGSDEIHPREIQKLMEEIDGTEEEGFISRIALRSMKRAAYQTTCDGHFGLAMDYYCHFTSPIRRYPDLQIHRIIKENLHGGLSPKRTKHYTSLLPEVAKSCSMLERRADDAEREVDKMKKAQYMLAHIGEEYEGLISSVTSWGIYVELPDTVEGMVRLTDMQDDHYEYDADRFQVTGKHSQKVYRMGQKVRVCVNRVDEIASTIDFEFISE